MNTNAKPKSANVTEQLRHMSDAGAEQSREALKTVGTASAEAADVITNCYSSARKGMQDYQSKIIEFSQANTKSYLEFVQRLAGVKSPSDFFEVSTEHTRHQIATAAEQTKQLAGLAQKVTFATAEPLKAGFAKAYHHAG